LRNQLLLSDRLSRVVAHFQLTTPMVQRLLLVVAREGTRLLMLMERSC